MKRILVVMLASVLLVAALTACAPAMIDTKPTTGVPNPIKEYKTEEAANEALGFSLICLPDSVGYDPVAYTVIDGKIGQVLYGKEGSNVDLNVRVAKGAEDMSGVYGAEYEKQTMSKIPVNIGAMNDILVAWFVNGDYTYAVSATGMERADFKLVVQNVAEQAAAVK